MTKGLTKEQNNYFVKCIMRFLADYTYEYDLFCMNLAQIHHPSRELVLYSGKYANSKPAEKNYDTITVTNEEKADALVQKDAGTVSLTE